MEFSLFAHMERLTPDQSHAELYEDFISLCQLADEGGMRAIWTGEHHGMEFTIAPNPFLSIMESGASHQERKAGHWHGHRAVLASDQAGRRGCRDRSDDRRQAGTRNRPRSLFL